MANLLQELSVDEISLVDKPSNRNAWIALRKRDSEKPLGVDEMSLPLYQRNQDPVWTKRKRSKMRLKYSDVRNMVAKNDLPDSSAVVVWDALITKSDKGGGTRQEREARVGRMLESDYRNGGQLIEYLQKGDARMSRDSYEAFSKRESNRDSLGSVEMDRAVDKIMRSEPNLNKHEAIRKLLGSEEGARLYGEYDCQQRALVRKLDPNQGYPGNGNDVDDGDDEDDDENGNGKTKRKSGKAKASRMKCKSSGDGEDDDGEDCDNDEDGCDDNDDMEKLRRKGLRVAKAMGSANLVFMRKGDGKVVKFCQGCAAENKTNADKCIECGKSFAKF
jgi:hypothetical protein